MSRISYISKCHNIQWILLYCWCVLASLHSCHIPPNIDEDSILIPRAPLITQEDNNFKLAGQCDHDEESGKIYTYRCDMYVTLKNQQYSGQEPKLLLNMDGFDAFDIQVHYPVPDQDIRGRVENNPNQVTFYLTTQLIRIMTSAQGSLHIYFFISMCNLEDVVIENNCIQLDLEYKTNPFNPPETISTDDICLPPGGGSDDGCDSDTTFEMTLSTEKISPGPVHYNGNGVIDFALYASKCCMHSTSSISSRGTGMGGCNSGISNTCGPSGSGEYIQRQQVDSTVDVYVQFSNGNEHLDFDALTEDYPSITVDEEEDYVVLTIPRSFIEYNSENNQCEFIFEGKLKISGLNVDGTTEYTVDVVIVPEGSSVDDGQTTSSTFTLEKANLQVDIKSSSKDSQNRIGHTTSVRVDEGVVTSDTVTATITESNTIISTPESSIDWFTDTVDGNAIDVEISNAFKSRQANEIVSFIVTFDLSILWLDLNKESSSVVYYWSIFNPNEDDFESLPIGAYDIDARFESNDGSITPSDPHDIQETAYILEPCLFESEMQYVYSDIENPFEIIMLDDNLYMAPFLNTITLNFGGQQFEPSGATNIVFDIEIVWDNPNFVSPLDTSDFCDDIQSNAMDDDIQDIIEDLCDNNGIVDDRIRLQDITCDGEKVYDEIAHTIILKACTLDNIDETDPPKGHILVGLQFDVDEANTPVGQYIYVNIVRNIDQDVPICFYDETYTPVAGIYTGNVPNPNNIMD